MRDIRWEMEHKGDLTWVPQVWGDMALGDRGHQDGDREPLCFMGLNVAPAG